MRSDDQSTPLENDLDLEESELAGDAPRDAAPHVDRPDDDDNTDQQDGMSDVCLSETDEDCSDVAEDVGVKIEPEASTDDLETRTVPRWLQAVPFVGALPHVLPVLGVIWRCAQNPLGLVVVAVAGLMGVFVLFEPTPAPQTSPVHPARPAVFPTADFRTAQRGAVTDRQVGALLAHYAHEVEELAAGDDPAGRSVAEADAGGVSNPQIDRPRTEPAAQDVGSALVPDRPQGQTEAKPHRERAGRSRGHGARRGRNAGRRTTPVGSGQAVAAETPDADDGDPLPAFLFSAGNEGEDEAEEETRADEDLQLSEGTRIRAVLDLGISSARHGTVVARTTQQVTDAAGVVIPKGSVLTGRSSNGHNRIFIDVTGVRVGIKQYRLRGVATRGEDLGLDAERVETPLEDRTSARVADGALGVLKGLAAVAAGPAGHALSQTAGGAIEEVQREQRIDRNVTLKVPAGTGFTVVITG
jgi:hypothetical protein